MRLGLDAQREGMEVPRRQAGNMLFIKMFTAFVDPPVPLLTPAATLPLRLLSPFPSTFLPHSLLPLLPFCFSSPTLSFSFHFSSPLPFFPYHASTSPPPSFPSLPLLLHSSFLSFLLLILLPSFLSRFSSSLSLLLHSPSPSPPSPPRPPSPHGGASSVPGIPSSLRTDFRARHAIGRRKDPSPGRRVRRTPSARGRGAALPRGGHRVVRIVDPRPSSRSLSPPRPSLAASSSPSRSRSGSRPSSRPSSSGPSSRSPSSSRSDLLSDARPSSRPSSSRPSSRSPSSSPSRGRSPRKAPGPKGQAEGVKDTEGRRIPRSPRDRSSQTGAFPPRADGEDVVSLEEIEDVVRWAEGVREELRGAEDVGAMPDLLPPSRLSLILQQLADGTFDEDKYIIGKRVDHYMSRATTNKQAAKKEGTGLGSASSPTWAPETRRPAWPAHPRASSSAPAQPRTSQGPSIPATHPPPLFSHLPRDIGPMAPLGSLQDFNYSLPNTYRSEAVRAPAKKKGKKESQKGHKVTGKATDSARLGQRDQATSSRVTTKDQATDGAKVVTRDQGTEVSKSSTRDQATESAARSTKTTGVLTDPAVSQGTQAGGKQRRLQIAPQGWINIRNENVAEVLPGVSIIPGTHHGSRKQATHALMEYVHPNSATDESASEIDEATRRRFQMGERSPDREPEMLQNPISVTPDVSHISDGNRQNADAGVHGSAEPGMSEEDGLKLEHLTVDESRSRRQEDGGSRPSEFSPRFQTEPSLRSAREEDNGGDEEEGTPLEERLSDAQNEAGNHAAEHPQTEYFYVPRDDAEQDVPEDRGRENKEGDECDDLPGYMPRVQWREVTIDSKMFDDEERMDRGMLQEAEERLLEHERRHRLLHSLQERLSRLLHTGAQPPEENNVTSVVPQADVAEESREDVQGNIQSPDTLTREYLTALVKERLQAYKLQTKEKEPEVAAAMTPPTSPSPREERPGPTAVAPPPDTPRDLLPDQPAVEKLRTPSPSPPPSEAPAPRREPTPQLSQETSDDENVPEFLPTPTSSPPRKQALREDLPHAAHTPSPTPVPSPAKRQTAVTPSQSPETSPQRKGPEGGSVVTPAQSPVLTHRSGRSAHTPSQSPSPRKSPSRVVAVPDTPTSSVPSPVPCPPPGDAFLPPSDTSYRQAEEFRTRVSPPQDPEIRQLTPPKISERKFSDEDIQIEYANVSVDLLSPETPSVVCNSSSDVTVASSVEAVDMTGISVSDGEILGGPTSSVSLSLEAGEVAKPDCMCLLTAAKSGTLQKGAIKMQKSALCRYHESLMQRSEGEVECSETSEGLLLLEGHSVGEDKTIQDSPEQSLMDDEAASEAAGSVQVSVVRDESYSSGDAQGLPRQHLEVLQRENAQLLNRLRNLGSMNFLRRSFQSSSSSSSK